MDSEHKEGEPGFPDHTALLSSLLAAAGQRVSPPEGVKHDTGKPDLSMVSWELMEAVARVREFGAKKYTKYGECTCSANDVKKKSLSALRTCVRHVTTLLTSKNRPIEPAISNICGSTAKTTGNGLTQKSALMLLEALNISSENDAKTSSACTSLTTPDWTESLHRLVVQYVDLLTSSASITATKQIELETDFVKRVTSLWDSWNEQGGWTKHSPTCPGLRIQVEGRGQWKRGFKVTRSCAAALRHIFQFLAGETLDPESGESHLAHAVCSLEHAIYDMKHHPANDDRSSD
jgi:hypothetical protein